MGDKQDDLTATALRLAGDLEPFCDGRCRACDEYHNTAAAEAATTLRAIAAERDALRAERDAARGYLIRNVIEPLHPNVTPLPDLIGVCTQIDNITAGLRAERDAALRDLAAARADLARAERVCLSIWGAGMIPVDDHAAHDAARRETTEALIVWQAVRSGVASLPPEARAMLREINDAALGPSA